MFSILLSLYHKEKPEYLEKCFESIWDQQTLKPTEIVLVLDGSIGEGLTKSVEHWQQKLGNILKIVTLAENVGLGKALNEGLKHCTNEWVFRMDTDDICVEKRFEYQLQFIKNNPNVVLFGGQILEFDQNIDHADKLKPAPEKYTDILRFSKQRNPFNHMTVAYKKSIILSLHGYQHHLFMEDYNLWLRVISKGYEVANLSQVLVYARVGNGMHARRRGSEYIKSEKQLLNLKMALKTQSLISAYITFILRSLFRFLPSNLLGFVYNNLLRKNPK
ncbi:glycosyl transferase 2 family protein [Acinetobacter sp. 1294596]|uniref:glycosyltransferase n=1 Tax=Acinetobacter sp. 1294596 TaxID=1310603 RepID=UPI0004503996|nr:glycosyltransferase [Acinetobacter sp. 1294596]EXF57468.1 glycosyl transferase 2 family protein [Acinetobacter sp. 1294596]